MRFPHLDNDQSIFLQRELEYISTNEILTKRPPLKSRRLIPTLSEIPEWARVFTWRMLDDRGEATLITDYSADLPRADVGRSEGHKTIKEIGSSYGYSLDEIRYSSRIGMPLDRARAAAALRAVNTKLDKMLALGEPSVGIEGLLNLTGAGTFTPVTKAAGGTAWGTINAPNATGLEVAQDIMGIASAAYIASNETFQEFDVVLPPEQYLYAASTLLSTSNGSNITALEFALKNEHVRSVTSWLRCKGAGAGGTDRMVAYPMDPEVVGAIVPQEPRDATEPQLRNLSYVVPVTAKCGGVISRFPSMVRYGDGI